MRRVFRAALVTLAIWLAAWCQTAARLPAPLDIHSGFFRGRPVTYEVVNGLAIFEGDIILGTPEELEQSGSPKQGVRDASVITGSRYRWLGGIVPYTIDVDLPNSQRILDALKFWNGITPIRLAPKSNQTNWVRFVRVASGSCGSYVGMIGGEQKIDVPDDCSAGSLAHEIGHAVGFWHTQSRQDRDSYVKVLYENLDKREFFNYEQAISDGEDVGPYDYGSLMHYSSTGFSRNGGPTIDTIPPGIPIGQRDALSAADLNAVWRVYGQPPSSTAVTSNPPGLEVEVDAVTYKTPKSFEWAPGTTHTLGVSSPQGSGAERYVFGRWSDDGAPSHAITASASETVFTANFIRQYLLNTGVSPAEGGSVTVSPSSPDGYYADGAAVQITAVPNPGYSFLSWTGLGYFPVHGYAPNPVMFHVGVSGLNYTAGFTRSAVTTITSNPPGLKVMVDDQSCVVPCNFTWTAGSTHTLSAVTAASAGGGTSRYLFRRWSDGGGLSHAVTAPDAASTYTANYTTQYLLTAVVSPSSSGDVAAMPGPDGGYYDAGTTVQLAAIPRGDYKLANWSGDLAGPVLTQPLTVNDQVLVTANFAIPRRLSANGTVNAASFQPGSVAPGEIITIFGLEIGPPSLTTLQLTPAGRVSTLLGDTQVFFDGIAAPLIYVSANQISAVVPYAVAGKALTRMWTAYKGQSFPYALLLLPVAEAAPALFTLNSSGRGPGAILNQDGSLNSASNPAPPGSIVVLYATGEGQTEPGGVDGLLARAALPKPRLPVKVRIGARDAEVLYAGAAPGLVAGVMQVNARVPDNAPSGSAVPIEISVGEARSPRTVTVAVR